MHPADPMVVTIMMCFREYTCNSAPFGDDDNDVLPCRYMQPAHPMVVTITMCSHVDPCNRRPIC